MHDQYPDDLTVDRSVRERLMSAILELDLNNRPICVHASLGAFTPRIPAKALVECFLEAGCTLLVPTFTYFFEVPPPPDDHPSRNGMHYTGSSIIPSHQPLDKSGIKRDLNTRKIYNRHIRSDLSLSDMGRFSATILEDPGSIRGDHPLNSFTALGPMATELIAEQNWEHVYSPLEKLTARDGKILLMGTDMTSLTFIHYAEEQSGRQLFIRWSSNAENQIRRTRVGSCSRAFNNLEQSIASSGTETWIQEARWRAFSASRILKQLTESIIHCPQITQCDNSKCLRCKDAVAGGPVATGKDPGEQG